MKRFSTFLLAIIMVLTFVACGSGDKQESKIPVKAEKQAAEGIIPEMKYGLGTDPDKIIEEYEDYIEANEGTDVFIDETEGELTVRLSTIDTAYYYEKENKEHGVAVLINFADSYGYLLGITMIDDIKKDFAATPEVLTATEEQMYFFPSAEDNCVILRYTYGSNRLDFFFVDDFLAATVLTNTNYWTD